MARFRHPERPRSFHWDFTKMARFWHPERPRSFQKHIQTQQIEPNRSIKVPDPDRTPEIWKKQKVSYKNSQGDPWHALLSWFCLAWDLTTCASFKVPVWYQRHITLANAKASEEKCDEGISIPPWQRCQSFWSACCGWRWLEWEIFMHDGWQIPLHNRYSRKKLDVLAEFENANGWAWRALPPPGVPAWDFAPWGGRSSSDKCWPHGWEHNVSQHPGALVASLAFFRRAHQPPSTR